MNIRSYNRIYIASGIALLVNIFLFTLLPNFVKSKSSKSDLETIIPVNLVQIRHQAHPPEKEEHPKNKPLPKVTPKVIPKVAIKHKVSRMRETEMEMPRLSFEINPKLAGGISVAQPAKNPVIIPKQNFKDFYAQGEVDQMPMTIFKMKPVYPYRAKWLHINGKVDVKFLVNKNGYVSDIKILKSTPPGIFDDSVLNALPSWKFSPGKVHGHAVSTWIVTTIEFKLEGV